MYIHLIWLAPTVGATKIKTFANARVNITIFASYHSYIINATSMELKPLPEGPANQYARGAHYQGVGSHGEGGLGLKVSTLTGDSPSQ